MSGQISNGSMMKENAKIDFNVCMERWK